MVKAVAAGVLHSLVLMLVSCGGGGGGQTPPPPPITSTVTGVSVSPTSATLNPGETKQFTATVSGTGNFSSSVTWSVSPAVGSISGTGLYTAPASPTGTVTVTATSTFDASKAGTAAVAFVLPAGPALMVDAAAPTHAISPMIYGMNFYTSDVATAKSINLPANRWGGNGTTRYNYKDDITNIGADWFFETLPNSNTNFPDTSDFNTQYLNDKAAGAKTIGTVPMTGWVGKRARGCSFSVAKYGAQEKTDQYFPDCGNGNKPDKTPVTGNDPNDANIPIVSDTWAGEWVTFLVNKFGNAASGGVAIYSLDNEPTWWDGNHRDVHPLPFTYDEVTNSGLKVAKAIKAADPTAAVSGPVIDFWPAYFYSMKDIKTGWSSGPNWTFNGNPVDRNAHGGKPLIEYYLAQFKQAEQTDGVRYLDYLDLHTYFAANNLNFAVAGSQAQELVRIDSTRALWDPTYIAPGHQFTDPDDPSSAPKDISPMIIRRMKQWIADDYPGTKTMITEYNWGAQESMSGAVAQADVLGIFGREGLDAATLWGPPDPVKQKPGLMAFKIYRNYDGANGQFGDMSLTATTADQSKLAVYAATRSSDHAVTIMVINKTYGDLTDDLVVANLSASGAASVYLYSGADTAAIHKLADATVTTSGGTTSTIKGMTFPAMSVTLVVVK